MTKVQKKLRYGPILLCLMLSVSGCMRLPGVVREETPKGEHLLQPTPAPVCRDNNNGDLLECVAEFNKALASCNDDKSALQ